MATKTAKPAAPKPAAPKPAAPKAAPRHTGDSMKVRATQTGYYGHILRREGDVFLIEKDEDFADIWMEYVDARTPEKVTTAQQALGREHDSLKRQASGVEAASVGPDNPTGSANVLGGE